MYNKVIVLDKMYLDGDKVIVLDKMYLENGDKVIVLDKMYDKVIILDKMYLENVVFFKTIKFRKCSVFLNN